jgi:hypothetical protein
MPPEQRLLIVVVLAFLFVLGIGVAQQSEFAHRNQGRQQANTEHQAKETDVLAAQHSEDPIVYYTRWLVIFTAALAIATIVLVVATIMLWRTTEGHAEHLGGSARAAQTAADAALEQAQIMRVAQAAAIAIDKPQARLMIAISGAVDGLGVYVTLANNGNSVTRNMCGQSATTFVSEEVNFVFDNFQAGDMPAMMVGPHSTIDTNQINISVGHILLATGNQGHLFLSGWLEYDDIFFPLTKRHRMEYCFKIGIEGNLAPGQCQVRFNSYGTRNRHYDVDVPAIGPA